MRTLLFTIALAACQSAPVEAPKTLAAAEDPELNCASGCDKDGHDYIGTLSSEQYYTLRDQVAALPVNADSDAFDGLLYYGEQTDMLLAAEPGNLSQAHLAKLRAELARDKAVVQMRLVGDDGEAWAELPETTVPLGEKQHLSMDVHNLQAVETSGTVVRTTKEHLWARF